MRLDSTYHRCDFEQERDFARRYGEIRRPTGKKAPAVASSPACRVFGMVADLLLNRSCTGPPVAASRSAGSGQPQSWDPSIQAGELADDQWTRISLYDESESRSRTGPMSLRRECE